jgi:hypothetical protein
MKTSKPISKRGVNPADAKEVKRIKATVSASIPSEEDIREKANEIYLQRIERGEHGTEENDWSEAEKCLRDSE